MSNYLDSVSKFHDAFEHPIEIEIKEDNLELRELRLSLLFEEIVELSFAMGTNKKLRELIAKFQDTINENPVKYDKVETVDALGDMQYVLSGGVLAMGYTNVFDLCFDEIQRSNMSKMCATKQEAEDTIKYYKEERGETAEMHIIEKNGNFIVKRADGKILKNMYYSPANLEQFI